MTEYAATADVRFDIEARLAAAITADTIKAALSAHINDFDGSECSMGHATQAECDAEWFLCDNGGRAATIANRALSDVASRAREDVLNGGVSFVARGDALVTYIGSGKVTRDEYVRILGESFPAGNMALLRSLEAAAELLVAE